MKLHHLPLVVPILFLVVWLEYRHSKEHHPNTYKFESTILNICCGIIERVFDIYIYIGLYFLYNFLQSHIGIFELSTYEWWQWMTCFVAVDFLVYWYHRGGHEINFLWAAHVTHHQCEEYNFTVAFRNHILPNIFRGMWLGILPILGFSGEMIIVCLSISGLWQFTLHTKSIKKLGWLEYILSTPSSHRVHHASNEQYLDKNYGGFFIIWDRIFGTYAEEKEEVTYGITSGFKSLSPVVAYTHVWKDMIQMSKKEKNWRDKTKIWLGSPGGFYTKYKDQLEIKEEPTLQKMSAPMIYYVTLQLVITTGLMIGIMVYEEFLTPYQLLLSTSGIIFSAISVCIMMQGKKQTFEIEKMRILILGLVLLFTMPYHVLYIALILIGLASAFIGLEYVEEDWRKRRAVL